MRPPLALLMAAVVVVAGTAAADQILFEGGPLPSTSIVPNALYAAQRTIGQIAITYTGFVQIGPGTPVLFTVRPALAVQYALPSVFVTGDGRLGANLSTTAGTETVLGPAIERGVWFAFGLAIANGEQQQRRAAFYLEGAESVTALAGNLLPSGTALVVAGADRRALLAQLRVTEGALTRDQWQRTAPWYLRYSWSTVDGAAVDGLSTDGARLNVTCPNRIVDVNAATWGRPIGVGASAIADPSCDAGSRVRDAIAALCIRRRTCIVPGEFAPDPCPGRRKWLTVSVACQAPAPTSSTSRIDSLPSTASNVSSPSSRPNVSNASSLGPISMPPTPLASPIPTRSQLPPAPTGYRAYRFTVTLHYRTEGFSDQERSDDLSNFLLDMSAVLQTARSRFTQAKFLDPTSTTTKLSFLILPNSTDPFSTQLRTLIEQQLNTPGSALRNTTLMTYLVAPPVDLRVDEVKAVRCGDLSSETFAEMLPNACGSLSPTFTMSGADAAPFILRTYSIVFGTSLVTVLLAAGCAALAYWLRQRHLKRRQRRMDPAVSVTGPSPPASPSLISIVDSQGRVRGSALLAPPAASSYLSTSPYRLSASVMSSPPPSPRSPRRLTNRDRIEKWQAENRVRFASTESTSD